MRLYIAVQYQTLRKILGGRGGGGGGSECFNMYAFGVHLRHANYLSNIMLAISNSLFNYCNVRITLYAYTLVWFLVPLALSKLLGGERGLRSPPPRPLVSATVGVVKDIAKKCGILT